MQEQARPLAAIVEGASLQLEEAHAAREVAYPLTRKVVQSSANAIRAAHRHDFPQSRVLLAQAQGQLQQMLEALAGHPDIYYAGYVSDAQKEYAEAHATLAFLSGAALPGPGALKVEVAPYLNGLAEAASELRRAILDALRRNDVAPCEGWMAVMDEVYSLLVTIDFPDAVTGGLRRTTDQLRGVLERTRGDLTMALRQHALEGKLAEFQEQVRPDPLIPPSPAGVGE
ncbi:MAG: haloacid dehalogenase [Chloroflexi bacterium]|nr:haloacid dehalogenase [Chloroflexota bacterium]